MTSNGEQFGGCIGFLKSLQRIVREYQPSAVVVAWEGGGSQRRRKLFPDYKAHRRPVKLNRFYGDDIPESEDNKQHQLVSLISMLRSVPVCQVYASDCEGDDIIAYLCKGHFRDRPKVVVSSDKDMYQLLDETTTIYSLHRKRFIAANDIFEEHNVKTHNFALAKCLCGDDSDNIPGIKGLGYKTAATKFPFLGSDNVVLVQELLDFAASHSSESPVYKRVFESASDVKRNWQLVHLDGSMLAPEQMKKVDHAVDTYVPSMDKMSLLRSLIKSGINDFDTEQFCYDFSCIEGLRYSSAETNANARKRTV